ncbi:MAG: hypothetical protein IKL31_01615 [Ruminococcus sp.]|nr:hypothetical protein [Ruminococcus sp.]MBR6669427.1 hypothetical protein [Ruminococcus sp.]
MPKKLINRHILLVIGIVVLTAVAIFTAGLKAKFVRKVNLKGSVEFSSELAKNITLNESKANITDSGKYELDISQKVLENSYKVMPGVNIPKDPEVTVTGKTGVPSYLFIMIEEKDIPDSVVYSLCDHWKKLDNSDNVYVYTKNDFNSAIKIIKDDVLIVSQQYDGEAFNLDFTAYLYQKLSNETPEQTFSRENQTVD